MELVTGAARLILAVVFAIAAWTKLLDRDGFRASIRALGGPVALAPVIPFVEFGVAAGVLLDATARGSATVGLLLLGAFTVAMVVALARGQRPECRCFGKLSAAPIGAGSVARNVAFIAVALVVAIG